MKIEEWKELVLRKVNGDFRSEQASAAEQCFGCIRDGKMLMLEAPTGSGKTLIMLGAALLSGRKVLVSTSGKMLQEQASSTWKKLTGESPVILMGRHNYVCSNMTNFFLKRLKGQPEYEDVMRLSDYLKSVENDPRKHQFTFLAKELKWTEKFRNYAEKNLAADSGLCLNGTCGKSAGGHPCMYDTLLHQAEAARLVIMNHHTLITLAGSSKFAGDRIFSRRFLFVDEAHDLAGTVSSLMTQTISTDRILGLTVEGKVLLKKESQRWLKELLSILERLNEQLCKPSDVEYYQCSLGNEFWENIQSIIREGRNVLANIQLPANTIYDAQCQTFLAAIEQMLSALDENPSPANLRPLMRPANGVMDIVRLWFKLYSMAPSQTVLGAFQLHYQLDPTDLDNDTSYLRYLWTDLNKPERRELRRVLIEPEEFLSKLWPVFRGVVFLSATLTIPGQPEEKAFDWFRTNIGIPLGTPHRILPPVFNLKENCRVFLPRFRHGFGKNDPNYLRCRAEAAGRLIRIFQGRTLMLFTSRERLNNTGKILSRFFENLPCADLLVQNDSIGSDSLAEQFCSKPETALLGSRTFFQGFDAPGETLSCLVLEKLPFAQYTDPLMQEKTRRAGENGFERVILPEMLLRLRQAFGRLLRSPDDRGIFVLMDDRIAEGNLYSDAVRAVWGADVPCEEFSGSSELVTKIQEKPSLFPFSLDSDNDFGPVFESAWAEFHRQEQERVLRKFGIPQLHDWQKRIIQKVEEREPVILVVYPAGSGKSVTYQLPALMMQRGLVLVVSPLIALMYDQVHALERKGFGKQCAMLSSGMSDWDKSEVIERARNGTLRLLYVSPERMTGGSFAEFIKSVPGGIQQMVIDEAHMISESGMNFRPLYRSLPEARKELGNPPLMLVTATAGDAVRRDLDELFQLDPDEIHRESVVRPKVRIVVRQVNAKTQIPETIEFIRSAKKRPVLIYAQTKKYVHSLAQHLYRAGFEDGRIALYEGDMFIEERNRSHCRFLNGEADIMVATSAYGMGIDKPDIWGVLFHNIPNSVEELVQGFGRVCRDNKLLDQYFDRNTPPCVQVNYLESDFQNAKNWFIQTPFEERIQDVCNAIQNMAPIIPLTDSLNGIDDPHYNALWTLLDFLKKKDKINGFRFSWFELAFHVDGKPFSASVKSKSMDQIQDYLTAAKQQKVRGLEEVKKFCLSTGCRNQFLQQYFLETEQPGKCCFCDNDGQADKTGHLKYLDRVREQMRLAVQHRYPDGFFKGTRPEFIQEIEKYRRRGTSGIEKLWRIHHASGKLYSDAGFFASLLEYEADFLIPFGFLSLKGELRRLEKFQALLNMPEELSPDSGEWAADILKRWPAENIEKLIRNDTLDDPVTILSDIPPYIDAMRHAENNLEKLTQDDLSALEDYATDEKWQAMVSDLRKRFSLYEEKKLKQRS